MVRNITLSDITASDVQSKCSWIVGLPGHPVENVTLRNVSIQAPGFSSHPPALSDDEKGPAYPNADLFYSAPAAGIFIRHARNITLDHLTFETTSTETRPPLLAVDVHGLIVRAARGSVPGQRPVFLRAKEVESLELAISPDWDGPRVETFK